MRPESTKRFPAALAGPLVEPEPGVAQALRSTCVSYRSDGAPMKDASRPAQPAPSEPGSPGVAVALA